MIVTFKRIKKKKKRISQSQDYQNLYMLPRLTPSESVSVLKSSQRGIGELKARNFVRKQEHACVSYEEEEN